MVLCWNPNCSFISLITVLTNSAPLSDCITLGNPKSATILYNSLATVKTALFGKARTMVKRVQTSVTTRKKLLPAADVVITCPRSIFGTINEDEFQQVRGDAASIFLFFNQVSICSSTIGWSAFGISYWGLYTGVSSVRSSFTSASGCEQNSSSPIFPFSANDCSISSIKIPSSRRSILRSPLNVVCVSTALSFSCTVAG